MNSIWPVFPDFLTARAPEGDLEHSLGTTLPFTTVTESCWHNLNHIPNLNHEEMGNAVVHSLVSEGQEASQKESGVENEWASPRYPPQAYGVSPFTCVAFFVTPWSQQGSSVHGILQGRIPEWVALPSTRGPSQPRDQTCVSYVSFIGRRLL